MSDKDNTDIQDAMNYSLYNSSKWLKDNYGRHLRATLVTKEDMENLLKRKENKMSKIKELFGVEIGERFSVKISDTCTYTNCCFDNIGELLIGGLNGQFCIDEKIFRKIIMGEAKIIKHEKPILTEEEHDYLQAICNPKFHKGEIKRFQKQGMNKLSICVETEDGLAFTFDFDKDLFKGMKLNEKYTPEELDIKKGD